MTQGQIEAQQSTVNRLRAELGKAAGHGLVERYDNARDRLIYLIQTDFDRLAADAARAKNPDR